MTTYRINEIFYSLQGEGHHTGRAAVFVRFSGCNLKCPFCDTDFSSYQEMTLGNIMTAVSVWRHCGFVVLTGGEPSLQADDALVEALHQAGFYVAMETNGTHAVPQGIDWVTVSPKSPPSDSPTGERPERINELKVIFDGKTAPRSFLPPLRESEGAPLLYLQPCDTGNPERNTLLTSQCVEYIKEHPEWRLSLQTHKILQIR